MTSREFRKCVFRTPFQPVRITLDAGEPLEVRHPETIAIGPKMAVVMHDSGEVVLFEMARVVSVTYLKAKARS